MTCHLNYNYMKNTEGKITLSNHSFSLNKDGHDLSFDAKHVNKPDQRK